MENIYYDNDDNRYTETWRYISIIVGLDQIVSSQHKQCDNFFPSWFCLEYVNAIVWIYMFLDEYWPEAYERIRLAELGSVYQCKIAEWVRECENGEWHSSRVRGCWRIGNLVSKWRKVKFNVHYTGIVSGDNPYLWIAVEYRVPLGKIKNNYRETELFDVEFAELHRKECEYKGCFGRLYKGSVLINVPANALSLRVNFGEDRGIELKPKENCKSEFCFKDEYTVYVRSEMSICSQ